MSNRYVKYFTNGLLNENPTLRLMLGTCPTLAVTTAAFNGIGMGLAATAVLVCSNAAISLLRKVIPDKVRIPAFITIIAGFVSVVQMLVKAFAPAIDRSLGIYLPLIVVNCIILARAEMFASKNSVFPSILDGLGMGIGFTATLTLMGMIREFFGAGTLFGFPITQGHISPMILFLLPPGGFFVFGMLVAASNALAKKQGKPIVEHLGCENCPSRSSCERYAADLPCENGDAPAESEVPTTEDAKDKNEAIKNEPTDAPVPKESDAEKPINETVTETGNDPAPEETNETKASEETEKEVACCD